MLAGAAGEWLGENAFRLMPDDPAHVAPAAAEVLVGRLTTLQYTWAHPEDGPQQGSLGLGLGLGLGVEGTGAQIGVLALWADSWHQHPQARVLDGRAVGDVVTVGYDYVAEEWRWEIVLTAAPDRLLVRMDNVELTTGERYAAMTANLTRRGWDVSAGSPRTSS